MFTLARAYRERGMEAYSELQQAEFAAEADGYTATRHQREVGTGWFDAVAVAASGGASSTTAMAGSTETAQFSPDTRIAPPDDRHDDGLIHAHPWARTEEPEFGHRCLNLCRCQGGSRPGFRTRRPVTAEA